MTAGVRFIDRGVADTFTALVGPGDGTIEPGAVTGEGGPGGTTGNVEGQHAYADDGRYTVTIAVTGDDGGTTADTLIACSTMARSAGRHCWPPDRGYPWQSRGQRRDGFASEPRKRADEERRQE